MSYKSRERKRKERNAIFAARAQHNEQTAVRYYRTYVKHDCRCVSCGRHLHHGDEMIYRRHGHVKMCVDCADKDSLIDYVPSAKWELTRRKLESSRRRGPTASQARRTRDR